MLLVTKIKNNINIFTSIEKKLLVWLINHMYSFKTWIVYFIQVINVNMQILDNQWIVMMRFLVSKLFIKSQKILFTIFWV